METKAIWEHLRERFGEEAVGELVEAAPAGSEADAALGKKDYRPRDAFIPVSADKLAEVMAELHGTADLACDFCMCITGVDYPVKNKLKKQAEDKLAVVYHLYSYEHHHTVVVKTFVDRAEPRVPTVSHLWPGANWHERETFDLYGVLFTGHPDLRRIMLPEEFEGHPGRKDYVERPMVLGIPTTRRTPLDLLGGLTADKKPE